MLEIRSFRDILRLFFIFRREFQWAVVITVVVAVLGAFLLPSKYESNARLLVKPGRENTTLPIEVANRQALIAPSTQRDPIVDEEKLLTGRPIVRRVAERYLEEMSGYQPQGFWKTVKFYIGKVTGSLLEALRSVLQVLGIVEEQSPVDRVSKKLEKNFSVTHEPGSAVMEINFTWDDPLIAQRVVATWVDAYLEERTRALGRKSLHTFYEGEMNKVAAQIDTRKQQLQEQLLAINSVSVAERLDNLTNQINRLSDARAEMFNDRAGIRSFLLDAKAALKRQPQEVVTAREISLNPSQLDLKRRLNALKQERANLLRTYLPEAPPVQELTENIKQMEVMVGHEAERLERSKNLAPNGIVVNLKQQVIDAELRSRQLGGQIADYDLQLAQLRSERNRVVKLEPAISRLNMELASAEKSYALYAENLEKARIDQELDNQRISNIALVQQATHNPSRVFPKSLMILLLALPAGLAVGLLTIYACYLLDQRIHDGARIEEIFQVPLWTTLQDLGDQPNKLDTSFTANIYRLYSLLPLDRIETHGHTLALASARSGAGVSFVLQHLHRLLVERGHRVVRDRPAQPGEVALLDASALLNDQHAFITLRDANQIALVIEAKYATVPLVQHVLTVLSTAFGQVDGIILNRRQFEVPGRILQLLNQLRGQAVVPAGPVPRDDEDDAPESGARYPEPQPNSARPLAGSGTDALLPMPAPVSVPVPVPVATQTPAPAAISAPPVRSLGTQLVPVQTASQQATGASPAIRQYSWGEILILEETSRHRLLNLSLAPGQSLPLHYHMHRSKQWFVLSGLGHLHLNDEQRRVSAQDSVLIEQGQAHSLHNPGFVALKLYEVQYGDYFGDDDITYLTSNDQAGQ